MEWLQWHSFNVVAPQIVPLKGEEKKNRILLLECSFRIRISVGGVIQLRNLPREFGQSVCQLKWELCQMIVREAQSRQRRWQGAGCHFFDVILIQI